jgi:hypothetical protein
VELGAANVASGGGTPDLGAPIRAAPKSGVDDLRDQGLARTLRRPEVSRLLRRPRPTGHDNEQSHKALMRMLPKRFHDARPGSPGHPNTKTKP